MALITVSVRHDFVKLREKLDAIGRKQLPFAAALALNDTAKLVQREMTAALPTIFDRPTPFTMRGIGIKPARKDDLVAEVFVKDIQAKYLKLEETGGERLPEKTALVMPVDIALNPYGNMTKRALQNMKARGSVFVGKVHGAGGFWMRVPGRGLRLLAAFRPKAAYKPRFHYQQRVAGIVGANFARLLDDALAKALATARR